jgi:hypothetical protein
MANPTLTMRKTREVLRLSFEANLSIRQIKASTKISVGTVQSLLARGKAVYPTADTKISSRFEVLDWKEVHQELKRKGVTK